MVWRAKTSEGVGKIIRMRGKMCSTDYMNILREGLMGTLEVYDCKPSEVIFMQDNDPKHTVKITKEWLKVQKIRMLEWPANTPDLNLIEHAWSYLEKRIRMKKTQFANKDELWGVIKEEWYKIPLEYL